MSTPPRSDTRRLARSRTGLVFIVFLVIAAFFLITEHRAHLFGILPYALPVLSAPLLLFMHREPAGEKRHNGRLSEDRK